MKAILNSMVRSEKEEMARDDQHLLKVVFGHKRFFMRAMITLILT